MDRLAIRDYSRKLSRIEAHDVSDADMDAFMDEGFRRVQSYTDWDWMYSDAVETVSMVAGTATYAIDTAVEQIYGVLNTVQRYQLRSMSRSQLIQWSGSTISSSRPSHFTFKNGSISVFPTPAASDDLDIHYRVLATFDAADIDVPPFNELFHQVLVDFTMHRLWEMEEDFEKSSEYRARFEEGMMAMAEWYNSTQQDTPKIYGETNAAWRPTNMPFLDSAVPI